MPEFPEIVDELINTSIQKVFVSGVLQHDYNVSKRDLERQRMTPQFLNDINRYCDKRNIGVSYDNDTGEIDLTVDLNTCSLNRSQAAALSSALAATYQGE